MKENATISLNAGSREALRLKGLSLSAICNAAVELALKENDSSQLDLMGVALKERVAASDLSKAALEEKKAEFYRICEGEAAEMRRKSLREASEHNKSDSVSFWTAAIRIFKKKKEIFKEKKEAPPTPPEEKEVSK